ncbi:hypothetical protein K491DRAFT_712910 [Lophiostoma macrostomum CBS 122681]|uniref:Uncharacterized protein n=1 Tax=Lophiostoma macrostomum CBS 122681 TaxID=1314788 RepID=A0A6A6TKI6_9PLEO|nr:hypothetical protein K491DRAFT_712910 [Lophiostoma macrostomum CBS 122681]
MPRDIRPRPRPPPPPQPPQPPRPSPEEWRAFYEARARENARVARAENVPTTMTESDNWFVVQLYPGLGSEKLGYTTKYRFAKELWNLGTAIENGQYTKPSGSKEDPNVIGARIMTSYFDDQGVVRSRPLITWCASNGVPIYFANLEPAAMSREFQEYRLLKIREVVQDWGIIHDFASRYPASVYS